MRSVGVIIYVLFSFNECEGREKVEQPQPILMNANFV